MKRFVLIVMVLLMLLLCGCSDYCEPEDRRIITALGVNRDESGICLTAETLDVDVGGELSYHALVAKGRGVTLEAALSDLQNSTYGRMMLSQCPVILLGAGMDQGSMQQVLDFCFSGYDLSPSIDLLCCEDPALLISGNEQTGTTTGEELSRLVRHGKETFGMKKAGSLPRVVNAWQQDGRYLLFHLRKENEQYQIDGVGLFERGKCQRVLPLQQSQLLAGTRGELYDSLLLVDGRRIHFGRIKRKSLRDGVLCLEVRSREIMEDTVRYAMETQIKELVSDPTIAPFVGGSVTQVSLSWKEQL